MMQVLKRVLNRLFGSRNGRGRQERMFRILSIAGVGTLLFAIIIECIMGELVDRLIMMGFVTMIIVLITIWSLHAKRIETGAVLISAVLIFVLLPYNFFASGGTYGGAPIWILFGVIYVSLVVERKTKFALMVGSLLVTFVCYYLAYHNPRMVTTHAIDEMFLESLLSLIVVSGFICWMILYQNRLYRAEAKIAEEQRREIEELNKAQNSFFSSMSHEIRTPINTIIGLNEMILRADVPDEVAEDAKNIQSASKMLLALINDILDMSKMESGKMDIVPVVYNVGDMLSDLVNMIWARAKEKGLEFHIEVDPAIPMQLMGDEVRTKQILINVLNNALKYTDEGSVTLSIQCKRGQGTNVRMIYTVTDTGIGIKKENIPHLFHAFRRVDQEKNRYIEGTGLGLSIVKQLVDLMNGDIAVNSVYTKGSTFVISLPQSRVGEDEIGELNLETRHVMNARKLYRQSFEAPKARILIVDDNDTNLLVAEKLLRETKVQIDTADSGVQCLKKALQTRYDVILMDHLMPGMDGVECLRRLRSQTGGLNQNTPVVALTANADSESQMLYRREGFDGYLLKPVTGSQLESEVLRLLPRELVTILGKETFVGVVEGAVRKYNKKMQVLIATDSVCDLPKAMIEKYKIAVMPYCVITEEGEFLDGVETESEGVLAYLTDGGKCARSESPSVADYEEFFAEQLTKAEHVIHISMAKNVSDGWKNALEAAKVFDNVVVLNSGHLSSGMGISVLHAARCVTEGFSTEAIVQEVELLHKKIQTSFIVDTTEYLAQVGRISANISRICATLMLHPVLTLKNSAMKVGAIWMGTRMRAWEKYISATFRNPGEICNDILFITYSGLSNDDLKSIEEQVKRKIAFKTVVFQKASPAISTNCGPGCFGLLYVRK